MKDIIDKSLAAVHTDSLNEIKNNKEEYKNKSYLIIKNNGGITLIALVITTIFCYDEFIKSSNNKGFLLQTI